jgi:hypothetical protein
MRDCGFIFRSTMNGYIRDYPILSEQYSTAAELVGISISLLTPLALV